MTESQFGKHAVPFYTGRLRGLRSFAVTRQGELTGITYAGRWADGENEAKCALKDSKFYDFDSTQGKNIEHDPEHQVASIDCSCGYYAYFDGNDNEYQHGVNVEGIVEAWGRITIGDRGFRTAKARIVALVIPKDLYPQTLVGKLAHRLGCEAKWYQPHAWSYPYLAHEKGCELPLFPHPSMMDLFIKRYQSAEIFPSLEDAAKAFPLTPAETAREIVGAE